MNEQIFLQELKELDLLQQAMTVIDWDSQTGMPEASSEYRGETMGYLSSIYFEKK